MDIERLRVFCLSIKGAHESFPFDDTTLVFKVMDKMFAALSLDPKDGVFWVALKCDPEKATKLRECYEGIEPAYHFNKKYWNGVYLNSDVPDELVEELILHSVDEVIKKMSRRLQQLYLDLDNE